MVRMISKTNCGDTMWNLNWVVISSKKNWGYNSTFRSVSSDRPHFPDKLKLARVTPIFKSGDPTVISNYRPISVLSCFSKLFEKIMYNRTVKCLDKFKLLHDGQYGFRSNRSTSLALILTNKIIDGFEGNLYTTCIFLDLLKAFDTINHRILLDKLDYYGFRGETFDWFSSNLSKRLNVLFIIIPPLVCLKYHVVFHKVHYWVLFYL